VGPEIYIFDDFDFGVAGNFGAEYAFQEVPITLGFDWRPSIIVTEGDFEAGNIGFIVRYRFGDFKLRPAN
jgi:hypothetical protein